MPCEGRVVMLGDDGAEGEWVVGLLRLAGGGRTGRLLWSEGGSDGGNLLPLTRISSLDSLNHYFLMLEGLN